MKIDPKTQVDELRHIVVQPVMINGVETNLQAQYDPKDIQGLNPLEKLNFFADLGNSIKKAVQNSFKVQKSVTDNTINAIKEISTISDKAHAITKKAWDQIE